MRRVWILLLLALLLCGCSEKPEQAALPTETVAPLPVDGPASPQQEAPFQTELVEAPSVPKEEPRPATDQTAQALQRPEPQPVEPHLEEEADGLYYIQADGTLLLDGSVGYLYFGTDGRCTCGDAALDEQVRALIAEAVSDPAADTETRLREVYDYTVGHFGYLGTDHYPVGSTDWVNEAAAFLLENGKANCYGFAGLFCLCARQLGYQAYVVAGHEYSQTNEHAWVMIDWPDGETYLFDPEFESVYRNEQLFKVAASGGEYRSTSGHPYYFP